MALKWPLKVQSALLSAGGKAHTVVKAAPRLINDTSRSPVWRAYSDNTVAISAQYHPLVTQNERDTQSIFLT